MRSARSAPTAGRRCGNRSPRKRNAASRCRCSIHKGGQNYSFKAVEQNRSCLLLCRRCRCTKKSWPTTARPASRCGRIRFRFTAEQLDRLGITPAGRLVELANDAPVRVAGLVLLRQRPGTAKGITFVTLEDETGTVNLVVHQHTWDRYYRIARRAPAWIAHGHIQTTARIRVAPVIHVVVRRLEALAEQLRAAGREVAGFSVRQVGSAEPRPARLDDGTIKRSRPPASRC